MRAATMTASRPNAPAVDATAAFERLFSDYHTPILNYLYRLVGDPATAEDLVQEAFTRAWQARAQVPTLENPRAWLYRIATNAARDHLRRKRLLTWLPFLGNEPDPVASALEADTLEAERMRRALLQLSPDYRIPLVLYTCHDFSIAEIATALGLSVDAVKQRLVRARQKLKEVIS